jgi:hypothetical protein
MDEASSDLSKTLSDLQSNLDNIADTKLNETFGNMTGSIREMSKELSKLGQLKALRDYQASVMAISAETAGIAPDKDSHWRKTVCYGHACHARPSYD